MSFPVGSSLVRLTPDFIFKPFDCGDPDLIEFLLSDSKTYLQKLLAVTYILESETDIVCFFSLLNDKIAVGDVGSGNRWNKLFKIPAGKNFKSHVPAQP